MSFFSSKTSNERFGLIIDIGSGSAMVAIVASEPKAAEPTIIWNKREVASLRQIDSLNESSKSVMTALVSVLLEFETSGRAALRSYQAGAKISKVQFSIAAPWAYTVVKNINYNQAEEFDITSELLQELSSAAQQKTDFQLKEQEVANDLGLKVATRATLQTIMNGYKVVSPLNKKATELSLIHTSVVVHAYLLENLKDIQRKMFPKISMEIFSYALVLHCVANDVTDQKSNICLIDVTYEATEMTIVRHGAISYVTHAPFGLYSLAREVAVCTKLPLNEAFQHLNSSSFDSFLKSLPDSQKKDVETALEAYVTKITELFKETGDDLAIPRQIIIHTEKNSEPFMSELIEKAARRAIKSDSVITLATDVLVSKLLASGATIPDDTALITSAHFFHKGDHCLVLEQA